MKAGILTTIYNRVQHVGESLQSLADTVPPDVPVIAMDDGSTDGARAMLVARFEDRFRVVLNPRNLGLCGSSNVGFDMLRKLGVKVFIRVNSDVLCHPGWYEGLVAAMNYPNAGVAGPVYRSFGTSGFWPNQDAHNILLSGVQRVPCVVGHCIAVAKGVLDDGFQFDEGMYPVGPCDVDLCCFSTAYGYQNVVTTGAQCTILQAPKSTVGHQGFEYDRCFPEYQTVLRTRWGPRIYDTTIAYQYKKYPGESR
jgi:glycosyltransferase involved in cell wall biosynthesis